MDGRWYRQLNATKSGHVPPLPLLGGQRTDERLWMYEVLPVCMIEIGSTLASELKMLLLIMANGYMCCSGGWFTVLMPERRAT